MYLILRKIVSIAMADPISQEVINHFEYLVPEYLTLYRKLFKCTFRFKHHNLLHYGMLMLIFGSIKFMPNMRYEAKHKQIKATSEIMISRKNPSYTLA